VEKACQEVSGRMRDDSMLPQKRLTPVRLPLGLLSLLKRPNKQMTIEMSPSSIVADRSFSCSFHPTGSDEGGGNQCPS